MKRLAGVVAVGLVLGLAAHWLVRNVVFGPSLPSGAEMGAGAAALGPALEDVATGLEAPWELAFLPDGDLLVTERPGRLVRLSPEGARRWTTEVPGVRPRGEGGLLGLALDPAYDEGGRIWLYLTAESENRVERWRLDADGTLSERTVVVDGIPAASFHDGGRIAFGPDGMLWITTGDAGAPGDARDPGSLAGKILRVRPDGEPAPGNPSGTAVWSLGHRNPQGLAWDADGSLWATEHGPSGLGSGFDEVNRIRAGADYGWPEGRGDDAPPGTVPPAAHSGADDTWAPSGAVVAGGSLWFGGLRGQALYELPLEAGGPGTLRVHLFGDLGRVRQVRRGPDGALWILTSNRDGRGRARDGDDRVVRVRPEALRGGAGG